MDDFNKGNRLHRTQAVTKPKKFDNIQKPPLKAYLESTLDHYLFFLTLIVNTLRFSVNYKPKKKKCEKEKTFLS